MTYIETNVLQIEKQSCRKLLIYTNPSVVLRFSLNQGGYWRE